MMNYQTEEYFNFCREGLLADMHFVAPNTISKCNLDIPKAVFILHFCMTDEAFYFNLVNHCVSDKRTEHTRH